MKVARIVGRPVSATPITDREIVEMVTTNPGVLLERCWHRPVGRLVEGAFADITVLSGRGTGSPWKRIVAATERDVALVVIDGAPRYGYATLMAKAAGATDLQDDHRRTEPRRRPARPRRHQRPHGRGLPSRTRSKPSSGTRRRRSTTRRPGPRPGPRFADDAALELFLDMPDTRRGGRAGPPKNPATVTIPPVPTLVHDTAFFDRLDDCPIHGGVLAPLRNRF